MCKRLRIDKLGLQSGSHQLGCKTLFVSVAWLLQLLYTHGKEDLICMQLPRITNRGRVLLGLLLIYLTGRRPSRISGLVLRGRRAGVAGSDNHAKGMIQ